MLEVTDDSGFLALVVPAAYETFVASDWTLDQILAHFRAQMARRSLLIWGTGLEGFWKVDLVLKKTKVKGFREVNGALQVVGGSLLLTNYESLTMAAQFKDVTLPEKHQEDLLVSLPDGDYSCRFRWAGQLARVTPGHVIWSESRHGWIGAHELARGEMIRVAGNQFAPVESLRRVSGRVEVFGIEVEYFHNYFVGTGPNAMLVHNGPECTAPPYDETSGSDERAGVLMDVLQKRGLVEVVAPDLVELERQHTSTSPEGIASMRLPEGIPERTRLDIVVARRLVFSTNGKALLAQIAPKSRTEQGQDSFAASSPILCPRCTAVLQPWVREMQKQTCPICGILISR